MLDVGNCNQEKKRKKKRKDKNQPQNVISFKIFRITGG